MATKPDSEGSDISVVFNEERRRIIHMIEKWIIKNTEYFRLDKTIEAYSKYDVIMYSSNYDAFGVGACVICKLCNPPNKIRTSRHRNYLTWNVTHFYRHLKLKHTIPVLPKTGLLALE